MMKRFIKLIFTIFVVLILVQLGFFWYATTSPQWEYAKRALENKSANYDLRYCTDLPEGSRKDFSKTSWKPLPCINTATSLYNDKHRAGNCNKFMANPEEWGFHEVSAEDAVPGDLMLFLRKKDGARHAGVYTMNSMLGPLCANTVIGDVYVHYMPIYPFLMVHAHGFYKVRYYRYTKK